MPQWTSRTAGCSKHRYSRAPGTTTGTTVFHWQVLNFLHLEPNQSKVLQAWYNSKDIQTYDHFVARFKMALGRRRKFDQLLILRRGLGFCADDVTPVFKSQHYLCYHAVKSRAQLVKEANGNETCVNQSLQCLLSFGDCVASNETKLQHALRAKEFQRAGLGGLNDIATCWPDCPRNLPESQWTRMAKGLREAGKLLYTHV
ncbi:unnamed protein product [Durusdinium trenchii]